MSRINQRKLHVAKDDDRIPVDGPADIPDFGTDEDEREFWLTHTFSSKFWRKQPSVPDEELPPTRSLDSPRAK
jgi:hypothetical protein